MEVIIAKLLDLLDVLYIGTFMLTVYLVLKMFSIRLKKRLLVLIVGVLVGVVFGVVMGLRDNPSNTSEYPYVLRLFMSFLFGQFLAKYGLVTFLEKLTLGIIKKCKEI